ncbi:MAG TPA: TonB-dependent receptor [Cellvibrionaceae bacterium]
MNTTPNNRKPRHLFSLTPIAAALLILATGALAEAQDDENAASLETLVVVGNTTNVDISGRDLSRQQAYDLADVFRMQPSVTVGGSVGLAQKVYIRGMEDTLLNITVDGAPQTGTLFHHIGRVNVEPELLKQVEVQTGAGEATSGFGAIGGGIRFRTKDARDLLSPNQQAGALLKAGYFSNEGYKVSATGYGKVGDNWGLLGSLVHVDRDNMVDGDGNTLYGTNPEQTLGFLKLSGDISQNQSVSISYEHRQEEGEFGQRPNWPALEGDTLFPATAERRTLVGNYLAALHPALNLEATVYQTTSQFEQDRFDRWGLYGADITSYGFDLRNISYLGAHELTYGVEYRNDTVTSEYLADVSVWGDWAWDANIGQFEEQGDVLGVYVQNHYSVSNPLLISFGVRYDAYDLEQVTYNDNTDSDGVSVNVGALYQFTEALSLSAGYAEAMRGKEVGDAFTLEKRPGRMALAEGLTAEKVHNSEVGLKYDNGQLRAGASVYQMKIDDVIMDQLGGGPAPQNSVYYENVGTFESDGVELHLGYSTAQLSADLFFVNSSPTLNDNPVEGYEHIGLANASGDTWMLNLGYRPANNLEMGWNIRHVSSLNDIEVLHRAVEIDWIDALQTVNKPGYTVHDIFAEWQPFSNDKLTLGLAIYNLLDEQYRAHASVADYNHIPGWEGVAGVYEAGRDIRLQLSTAF